MGMYPETGYPNDPKDIMIPLIIPTIISHFMVAKNQKYQFLSGTFPDLLKESSTESSQLVGRILVKVHSFDPIQTALERDNDC